MRITRPIFPATTQSINPSINRNLRSAACCHSQYVLFERKKCELSWIDVRELDSFHHFIATETYIHCYNFSTMNFHRATAILTLLISMAPACAFSTSPFGLSIKNVKPESVFQLNAIGVLARKAKENDLRKMLEAGEIGEDVILKVKELTEIVKNMSDDDASESYVMGPLQEALTRRKGTITVIAEYKRKFDENAAFIAEILEPAILSATFREGGASAVAVMADAQRGGCSYDDLVEIQKEQQTAKGDIPGPLPVISSDLIVDELQIAQASISKASSVAITYNIIGSEEKLGILLKYCKAANLECIVNVINRDEATSAVRAGARLICASGMDGVENKADVFDDTLVKDNANGEPICKIAAVLARDNKQLEEVEEVWMLRDRGFNAVWVSDALYKSGNDPLEHPGAIIKSMKSKSSVKYASARARTGKGEGAREYLGDILF